MNKIINERIKSFYYTDVNEIPEVNINPAKTALLIMNMQNYQVGRIVDYAKEGVETGEGSQWKVFYDRFEYITLPAIQEILDKCRRLGIKVTYGTVALKTDNPDHNVIISDIMPDDCDSIYERHNKIGSSITAGTSFVEDMRAQGIDTIIVTGVATDQCISSSIRALSDEGFDLICVDEACATDCMEQQDYTLRSLNFTYCLVVSQLQIMELLDI